MVRGDRIIETIVHCETIVRCNADRGLPTNACVQPAGVEQGSGRAPPGRHAKDQGHTAAAAVLGKTSPLASPLASSGQMSPRLAYQNKAWPVSGPVFATVLDGMRIAGARFVAPASTDNLRRPRPGFNSRADRHPEWRVGRRPVSRAMASIKQR
jgi:hypothetical protein